MSDNVINLDQQDWLLAVSYVYIQMQHYDKAIDLLESLIALDDAIVSPLKLLSYAYFKKDRFEEAFVASRKWLQHVESKPSSNEIAPMYLLQGCILLKLNRKDLAKKCMQKYKLALGESHV